MQAGSRKLFLLITALVETATVLRLLFLPAILFAVLLGLGHAEIATIFVGRLAGAALLAIASFIARADTSAQLGLLNGILVYNMAASILLAYAGLVLNMTGVLLWPAVAIHAILAVWCFISLRPERLVSRYAAFHCHATTNVG
jgi:hypothetical protein